MCCRERGGHSPALSVAERIVVKVEVDGHECAFSLAKISDLFFVDFIRKVLLPFDWLVRMWFFVHFSLCSPLSKKISRITAKKHTNKNNFKSKIFNQRVEWWNRVDCPRPASRVSTRPGRIILATINIICIIIRDRMAITSTPIIQTNNTLTIRWRWKMASQVHRSCPCSTCGIVVVVVALTVATTTAGQLWPTTTRITARWKMPTKTIITTHLHHRITRLLPNTTISLKPLSRRLPLVRSKVNLKQQQQQKMD